MRLSEHYPSFYRSSPELMNAIKAMGAPMEQLQENVQDFFSQVNPMSATWLLSRWEAAYGLRAKAGDSIETRRSRVLAKMRGMGTMTVAAIQRIVQAYSDMTVEIEELAREYRFIIQMSGEISQGASVGEMTEAVRLARPAYLDFDFVFFELAPDLNPAAGMALQFGGAIIFEMEGIA